MGDPEVHERIQNDLQNAGYDQKDDQKIEGLVPEAPTAPGGDDNAKDSLFQSHVER